MMRPLVVVAFAFRALLFAGEHGPLARAVDSIGLTVSDLNRSVKFYSEVLDFKKIPEVEVDGEAYERSKVSFAFACGSRG